MERLRGAGDMREEYMSEKGSQGRGERVVSSGKGEVSYIACTLHEFAANKLKLPRLKNDDWLLTLLTAVLTLMIFVFAPLQAAGIFLFQTFAIAGLLVIIGGALIISGSPIALGLMSIAFIANFVVFFLRLYYPWPYNLHLLAAAWLIISITLGIVVAQAVFGRGRVTYHRIIGAILLYLLIAVAFATLFAFVGLSISDAFKGIAFEDDAALASSLFYLSFVTLTSTGYGDIVPAHPLARSLCNIESIIGQLYPATILARLVQITVKPEPQNQRRGRE
jgi:Ion channel